MAKDVVVKMVLEKSTMVKGLADVEAGFNLVYRSTTQFTQALSATLERGVKFGNLLRNNSLDISRARSATKGLVDDMTLLEAANTSVEFRLGLTSKQFASFAEAAVVQSQKLGIDANKALRDLLTGTARGSRRILDNLGFIVKEGAGVADVVEEINRKVGEQGVIADTAGAAFEQLRVDLSNTFSEFGAAVSENSIIQSGLIGISNLIKDVSKSLRLMSDDLEFLTDSGIRKFRQAKLDKDLNSFLKELDAIVASDPDTIARRLRSQAEDQFAFFTPSADELLTWDPDQGGSGRGSGRRRSRRGQRGGPGVDPTPPTWSTSEGTVNPFEQASIDENNMRVLQEDAALQLEWEQRRQEQKERAIELDQRHADSMAELSSRMKAQRAANDLLRQSYIDLAKDGLGSLTAGLVQAIDASVNSGESFGTAMLKILRTTLLGIAQQSAVLAVFHTAAALGAQGFFNFPSAVNHWAAAATFGSVAAVAGAGGIALGRATRGGSTSRAGSNDATGRSDRTRTPSFGSASSRSDEPQEINVNVYLGNDKSPSAMLVAKQQATATITGAMGAA